MWKNVCDWFRSFFGPRQRDDFYYPANRLVYRYFDGHREVVVDPLLVYKKIMAKGEEFASDIQTATTEGLGVVKAHNSFVDKAREVFGVKPLVEGGLTDGEVVDLLNHFLSYSTRFQSRMPQPPKKPPTVKPSTPVEPPPEQPPQGG